MKQGQLKRHFISGDDIISLIGSEGKSVKLGIQAAQDTSWHVSTSTGDSFQLYIGPTEIYETIVFVNITSFIFQSSSSSDIIVDYVIGE